MAKTLQLRRGTTEQNDSFTGAAGELVVDTDAKTLRLHDGTTAGGKEFIGKDDLANVATPGSYTDLSDKPTIPTVPTNVSAFTNDKGYLTEHQSLAAYAKTADLATVATSGSYTDLANKPTIPAAVTVDSALSSTSTNPVQNKVINSALAGKMNTVTLAKVATSGSYADLSNKPSLATVATSGSYNDLANKPTIPTVDSALSATSTNAIQNKAVKAAIDAVEAPVITVKATTLAAGSSATVTKTGTNNAPTFTFGIPKGDTGALGTITGGAAILYSVDTLVTTGSGSITTYYPAVQRDIYGRVVKVGRAAVKGNCNCDCDCDCVNCTD